MAIYRSINGVNREIIEIYRGISGVNREIQEVYRGVNGVNRKVFSPKLYVYSNGAFKTSISENYPPTSYWKNYADPVPLNKTSEYVEFNIEGTRKFSSFVTSERINVTEYSKLIIDLYTSHNPANSTTTSILFGPDRDNMWDDYGRFDIIRFEKPAGTRQQLEFDISSNSGLLYIGFFAGSGDSGGNKLVRIYELSLVK